MDRFRGPLAGRSGRSSEENAREEIARELDRYRARLRRGIELRLDPRLRGRIDASDIVQEALVEAVDRYPEYEERENGSIYLWLRFLAHQKLLQLRRYHLETAKRSVRCERKIDQDTSASDCGLLADHVAASTISPSSVCSRREIRAVVLDAIESLEPLDREILALRYFEELSNTETARIVGIPESTASARFLRGLRLIKGQLAHALDEE